MMSDRQLSVSDPVIRGNFTQQFDSSSATKRPLLYRLTEFHWMVCPPVRLLLVAAVVSFCSNWQFAFQITYVNTSVQTFYQLANAGYQSSQHCNVCWLPAQSWSSAWSTIVSSFYPGTILGFLLTPWLTNKFGVKKTQIVTCLSAVAGCSIHFLALFVSNTSEAAVSAVLIAGRFLVGIQSGSSLCLLPLYIIEISPVHHRAFLSTFQQVSQATGTLLGLLLGSEEILPLGNNRFIWLQIFAVAPTILFLTVLLFTPTTPHQLAKKAEAKGKDNKAKITSSLIFYHGCTNELEMIKKECQAAEEQIEQNRGASWKGFTIGAAAAASYAFTADDLVDTFSAQILSKSQSEKGRMTTDSADLMSVAFGALLLISSLFGTVLIDRFGRRKLLLLGLVGSALSNALVVAFSSNFIIVTAAFSFTKIFIGLGAGAPAWFLTSELVDPAHVSLFQSLSTGLLLTSTMLVTFFFLQLDYMIGSYSILALATGPALLLAFFLYLFLPETKDQTIAEVQLTLSENTFSGFKKKKRKSPMYGTL